MSKKVLAIIPARGNLQYKIKNIVNLNGKPLIEYTTMLQKEVNKLMI